jgi:hypothetical protein
MPYLAKGLGIRVENLLGALLGLWAGAVVLVSGRLPSVLLPLQLVTLSSLLFVVCVTVLSDGFGNLKGTIGRIDHYLRPLTVLLLAGVTLGRCSPAVRDSVFLKCARILLSALFCNTLVQVASLFMDIEPYVGAFRPAVGGGMDMTVAESAAQNSRLMGIFNQPLEQGTVYAVGCLVWVELWRRRVLTIAPAVLSGTAIVVGGILGFSKVFLLGGLPFGGLLLLSNGVRLRDLVRVSVAIAVAAPIVSLSITYWQGAEGLFSLLEMIVNPATLAYAVSGGRLGVAKSLGEEYLISKVAIAFRSAPVTGVGLGAALGLGDNEYLLSLGEGGLLLLTLIVIRQVLVFVPALPRVTQDPEARLLLALGSVLVLGAMGGPVSGVPRCGTVLWVFIALLMINVSDRATPVRSRSLVQHDVLL